MNQTEINKKYEMEMDKAISEYRKEIKKIREIYKEDIADKKVSDETNKLKSKAKQLQQSYIEELKDNVEDTKKELKEQETINGLEGLEESKKMGKEKEKDPLQAAVLKQLERSNNILETMIVLESKNETAILSLIEKHKENKEMLNLIKCRVDEKISDNINNKLKDIELNSLENQIKKLEGNLEYEKSLNRLENKAIQVIGSVDNPYFNQSKNNIDNPYFQ